MKDITNTRLLYLKGGLFLTIGIVASVALLVEHPTARVAVLLAVAVWGFARAYYFAFYVVEHYVDGRFRFSGLGAFLHYLIKRGRGPGSLSASVRKRRRALSASAFS